MRRAKAAVQSGGWIIRLHRRFAGREKILLGRISSPGGANAESVKQRRPELPTFVGNPGWMYDETLQS
jgi:hypothetical protein